MVALCISPKALCFLLVEFYRVGRVLQVTGIYCLGGAALQRIRRESTALEVSRTQGAKMLELRAVTDLSRLIADQGAREEAFDLLAPVYE